MLPQFPKTQAVLTEHWNESLLAGERETLPDTLRPPSPQIIEGKQSSYQREDRNVVPLELSKHIVERTVDVSDGKGMTFDKLLATAKELGRELGGQILERLFAAIEKTTKETGNVVKTHGQFSKADFLKLISMTEHSFERGNPTNIFVASPEFIDPPAPSIERLCLQPNPRGVSGQKSLDLVTDVRKPFACKWATIVN